MHLRRPSSRLATTAVTAAAAATVTAALISAPFALANGRGDDSPHDSGSTRLDHVFVIMLENHSKEGVIGDVNAPYITSLADTYSVATHYYGVTHPSLPNYVATLSGSNWDVNNDDPNNRFDHTNLVDSLENAHLTWGAYMEAMPANDKLTDYWPSESTKLYASKHNPFVLFDDIRNDPQRMANVKPYTDLAGDLNSRYAPNFVFISPDQCNDMHGGVYTPVVGYPETQHCGYGSANDDPNDAALKQNADAFVKQAVTTIMSSRSWTRHSAIFIVADEGDYNSTASNGGWATTEGCCDSPVVPAGAPDINAAWPGGVYGGGLVPAIVIPGGNHPHHVVVDTPFNHYSLLRTVEDAFGLPEIGYSSDHVQVRTMDALLAH